MIIPIMNIFAVNFQDKLKVIINKYILLDIFNIKVKKQ